MQRYKSYFCACMVFCIFKRRLNLEPGQLEVCKTGFAEVLSYQTLITKDNTDLECTRKLQAFKKASSLMGLGIQAQYCTMYIHIVTMWEKQGLQFFTPRRKVFKKFVNIPDRG